MTEDIKEKEKAKAENKNFDKIELIDRFVGMRRDYLNVCFTKENIRKFADKAEHEAFDSKNEEILYD